MRKINILNKNYEVANLNTVVYEGYSIKQIIEDSPVFDVTPPQHYLDYWQKIYDYLKDGTQLPGHTYIPSGQSKYDIAYINKTIDDPIADLNGHTLKEIYEVGNLNRNQTLLNEAITNDDMLSPNNILWLNDFSLTYGGITFSYDKNTDLWTLNGTATLTTNYFGDILNYSFNSAELYYKCFVKSGTCSSYSNFIANFNTIQPGFSTLLSGITHTGALNSFRFYIVSGVVFNNFTFRISVSLNQYEDVSANKYILNKTSYSIESLTVEQMDYYYSLYLARKDITKKTLTYADIFEEFQVNDDPFFEDVSFWSLQYATEEQQAKGIKVTNDGTQAYSNYFRGLGANPNFLNGDEFYASVSIRKLKYETQNFQLLLGLNDMLSFYPNTLNVYTASRFIIYESSYPYLLLRNYGQYADNAYIAYHLLVIGLKHFDEDITKEQLDILLSYYLTIKDIVIYPENFLPLEPTGFGNRYKFKELNTKVYGHEMDFEKMQLTLLFGTYRNAYESFNLLMNFMINNEAIISYDYGKGIRYTDVRLIAAPKTELDNGQHMRSKFDFKRLSPFYTIEEGFILTIKNVHDWDIKPIVSGTVNTNIVYIEAEDTTTTVTLAVKFDFTSLTKPFNFYYNAETKQILINGINNGYQYIDFSYGVSFISLPKDTEHLITTTGITSPVVKAKKWVID